MRKIIIVEGVDKAGKTTLLNALSKKYKGYTIKVTDRPNNDSEKERDKIKIRYQMVAKWLEDNKEPDFVLDRSFVSEMVYSQVMRGYEAYEDPFFKGMEMKLRALGVLYIYCHPGYAVLKERHKKEKDDYVKFAKVEALLERYDEFYNNTTLKKIKVDTSEPVVKIIKLIGEAL